MTAPIRSIWIVADDLSGAADCAAAFARIAGPVTVLLGAGPAGAIESAAALWPARVAIDIDSRSRDAGAAAAATMRAFEPLARGGLAPDLVYKKIDSTLRGHLALELEAALNALPQFAGAIVAPSFPQQGRTLSGGRLLVQGRADHGFGHAGDLMAMLNTPALRPVLLGAPQDPRAVLARIAAALASGARAIVVDAAEDSDLACLASALCSPGAPPLLVAGSAGLARALAAHVEHPDARSDADANAPAAPRPVLLLAGSFSKATGAQIEEVEAAGDAQVLWLGAAQWLRDEFAAPRHNLVAAAAETLQCGGNVLFAIDGQVEQPFSPAVVAAMARATAPLLRHAAACVLTGGDTARAMFNELQVSRLEVVGEFEPGISIGRSPAAGAVTFVLKAGGFGDRLALQRIVRHFGPQGIQSAARRGAAI